MNRRDFLGKFQIPTALLLTSIPELGLAKNEKSLSGNNRNIEYIESYSDLMRFPGTFEGQSIYLLSYYKGILGGGGFFSWRLGLNNSDLGHICVPANSEINGYWESLDDKVDLLSYGIVTVNIDNVDGAIDMSRRLQNAFQRAILKNIPVYTNLTAENHYIKYGIPIKKGIDISGVKSIIGCLNLFLSSSEFEGIGAPGISNTVWALININAEFEPSGMVYGSARGNQQLSSITIRDIRPRSSPLSGQLHTFSGTNVFGSLCSVGLDGYGVFLASCYDSYISDVRAISCGNNESFAVCFAGYPASSSSKPDGFNSITVSGVMAHNCYDRSINITGAGKNRIERIHEEQTYVTTTVPWEQSATVKTNNWGYCNTLIGGDFSSYGTISIYPHETCSEHHVCTIVSNRISIDTFDTSGNVSIHGSYTSQPRALNIGSLSIKHDLWISERVILSVSAIEITEGSFESHALRCSSDSIYIYGNNCNFYSKNGSFNYLFVNGDASFNACAICDAQVINKTILLGDNRINKLSSNIIELTGEGNSIIDSVFKNDVIITGDNDFSDCLFLGNVSLYEGGYLTGCQITGSASILSKKAGGIYLNNVLVKKDILIESSSKVKLIEIDLNGDIIIQGGNVHLILDDVNCHDVINNALSGSWVYSNVIVSGEANSANTNAKTNKPSGRVISSDPYSGDVFVFLHDGWSKI